MTSAHAFSGGAAGHCAADGIERPLTRTWNEIEVKRMRSSTRIGTGVLLAAAALVFVFAAQPARAQSPLCPWPADVPGDLLVSIETCFNCFKNGIVIPGQTPCPPAVFPPTEIWTRSQCYEFPEDPTTQVCDAIASAEVKGCTKAVADAAKCNDAVNTANATAESAICSTFVDPSEGAACLNDVQSALAAQKTAVKNAAAAGRQACVDLTSSVSALCLGDPL